MTNVLRIRFASVVCLEPGMFPLRYLVVPESLSFRELIQYFLGS